MSSFPERVAGIGALADPLRRDLYLFICAQDHAVSRDEAADAVDVPLHKAKFHLDRLAADGLLDVEYARLSGRSGPGAGRPSKLYRRSATEISVSLPEREYELAGRLMAEAIAASSRDGSPVLDALVTVASEHGRVLGRAAREDATAGDALGIACAALAANGYEPRAESGSVTLANCPFHSLAESHTDLVCRMNLALVEGVVDGVGADDVDAQLDPADGRCCVVLAERTR
ncbi:helix-turn-helix transcriptional regulator [Aeromicrobium terrae]|uniref:Transcriptional regulator n=1 Tax=Aeromicrobium terrae TaxID=2498846 RepID=A0A5C8NC22_9ACTN|nr:helix-turn-helix domain-containing protein [Aeromicrobium terrae]TXL56599.1 transcriptional regulator [Aeromicrobium terrae]